MTRSSHFFSLRGYGFALKFHSFVRGLSPNFEVIAVLLPPRSGGCRTPKREKRLAIGEKNANLLSVKCIGTLEGHFIFWKKWGAGWKKNWGKIENFSRKKLKNFGDSSQKRKTVWKFGYLPTYFRDNPRVEGGGRFNQNWRGRGIFSNRPLIKDLCSKCPSPSLVYYPARNLWIIS